MSAASQDPASNGAVESSPPSTESDILSAVSAAVEGMARQPEQVPGIAVDAALALGLDAVAFRALDEDSFSHHLVGSRGFDEHADETESGLSARMADLVMERGETVVARRSPGEGDASLPGSAHGFEAAVAGPIWVEGWLAAVLVGAARSADCLSGPTIDAFGLLLRQAGLTLDNAHLVAEEQEVAGRLEAGDRLKNDFLTTISHELRTPLTVLMGSGLTLERTWTDLDDPGRLELLSTMNANVRILDDLLTQLLDYARMEAGELWVSFEPFDVSALVRKECRRAAKPLSGRRLVPRIEDDLLASGDGPLIRRVVSSLLQNAGAHTPTGTTVTVSCVRRDGEVVVEVADDGPGIAEADVQFLGERFFRGGDANARPKGLGLGLALARGILDLHESELVIERGPDGGACFRFGLPSVSDPSSIPDDRDRPAYAPGHGRA